jgi:hypothetical protein
METNHAYYVDKPRLWEKQVFKKYSHPMIQVEESNYTQFKLKLVKSIWRHIQISHSFDVIIATVR